ncbi:C-factor-like [Asterias rubens]|uniref:C-factor-like n=1 Tax=Asterias rubens TaxID=7604 RepID=UPI001455B028|nr:C-factor-like [Asterias rubens]
MFSVLVTGANRGLGLTFVRQLLNLAKPPEHVFACCRSPENAADLQTIASNNPAVKVLKLDVANKLTYKDTVHDVEQIVGDQGLNLLINNAGIISRGNVENASTEDMERLYQVNVVGTLGVTQAFLPILRRAASFTNSDDETMSIEKSAIVNISSIMGSITLNNSSSAVAYRTSKAALNMLTNCMSIEFASYGVLAVAMHPGWVQTDMGGVDKAPVTPHESVSGVLATLDKLKGLDASGKCYEYTGRTLPW